MLRHTSSVQWQTASSRPLASCLLPLAFCLLLLAGCGQTPVVTRTPVTFDFAVSSAVYPLIDELTATFRVTRPYVTFRLGQVNTAQARDALWAGQADLAALDWMTEADRQAVWTTPIGIDGVLVIVHPGNPIKNLSLIQLRDVFRGRVAEWPDVGGGKGEIAVVARESGAGTRTKFEEAVMDGRPVTVNAIVAPSEQVMLDYVRGITTAIGYVSVGQLASGVQAIRLNGVEATQMTMANWSYPLSRPVFFATQEEPQEELRDFVAWVLGPDGQAIVGKKFGRVK